MNLLKLEKRFRYLIGISGDIDFRLRQVKSNVKIISGDDVMVVKNTTVELIESMIVEVI